MGSGWQAVEKVAMDGFFHVVNSMREGQTQQAVTGIKGKALRAAAQT